MEKKNEVFKDLVCGMNAEKNGPKAKHKKQTYYFCSELCKNVFLKNPERFLEKAYVAKSPE